MKVNSLLSQKDNQHHNDVGNCENCGNDHEHTEIRLNQILIGLLFIINSFIIKYFFDNGKVVGDVNAMIGAMLLGYPIVWTAIKDLSKGRISTNELVALAVLASFASGEYQESGLVAFFMLLGEIIETRTAEGARASVESLVKLTPTRARRIQNGTEEEVEVKDLKVGDVIRIRPGDNIAADGLIVSGQASINQANITGESLPVDKKSGDEVFAGTQNPNPFKVSFSLDFR